MKDNDWSLKDVISALEEEGYTYDQGSHTNDGVCDAYLVYYGREENTQGFMKGSDYKLPKASEIANYFFDFNDNIFDTNFWKKDVGNNNVNDIRVENGVMKLEQNRTDVKTHLVSKEIPFNNSIVIERDVLLHHKYNQTFQGGKIFFSNRMALIFNNGETIEIGYFWDEYAKLYGTHVTYGITTPNQNNGYIFSNVHTREKINENIIFDNWFKEKLVINRNGIIKYYVNNVLAAEKNIGILLQNGNSFTMRFNPYAWWTGHYQHFDNFLISCN